MKLIPILLILLCLSPVVSYGEWIKPLWLPSIDPNGGTMAYFDSLGFQPDSVWIGDLLDSVWIGDLPTKVETVYVEKERGCGGWVTPVWDRREKIWINTESSVGNGTLETYYFYGFPDRLNKVWVPKPRPDTCGKTKHDSVLTFWVGRSIAEFFEHPFKFKIRLQSLRERSISQRYVREYVWRDSRQRTQRLSCFEITIDGLTYFTRMNILQFLEVKND